MDADLPSFNADPDLDSVFSQMFGSGFGFSIFTKVWIQIRILDPGADFFSLNSLFFLQENLLNLPVLRKLVNNPMPHFS